MVTRHDALNEDYTTWERIAPKLNNIIKEPTKYTVQELSEALDGYYQFGNPSDPAYASNKAVLKEAINYKLTHLETS